MHKTPDLFNYPFDNKFSSFTAEHVGITIVESNNFITFGTEGLTLLHLNHLGPLGTQNLKSLHNLSIQFTDIPSMLKQAK